MPRPSVEFWYEFSSTYSYLSAMRIEEAAEAAGVTVLWRPFLLGPIFGAQGWSTSPFNLYPLKGRYMWRDMEREAARLRLPLCRPNPFPQNSLLAARIALVGLDRGWTPDFTRAVFTAEFGKGRNISDPVILSEILTAIDGDPEAVLAAAESEATKARLRRVGEEAQSRGIFGAPTFLAEDGEMFWGNDRLDQALTWAVERVRRSEWPM
ncbi:2-hydroxychromene-2-carboxylate isomerase [Microvirga rosea]|uniref:2-hydroxychromene-2-carboxylate isomerase n=1 Tax=Microvirga rosea TaxID=2715425 RepID=UPI001D09E405|nr:2-hydroxychromene-2-carboxylate isomerase [Microvirga rosea]MCB8819470.1 2-hydroxychromene-2-carboxylate isomerase [Microvirga rosea]